MIATRDPPEEEEELVVDVDNKMLLGSALGSVDGGGVLSEFKGGNATGAVVEVALGDVAVIIVEGMSVGVEVGR